jgi:ABC-2 type transport system permease protein
MKYWRESLAVAQRILLELWRRRRSLIFWIIFPIVLLLINGYIVSERAHLTIAEAMSYAAPSSLVGAALFFSCLGGSVATVVSEREQNTLKRLFISPLSGTSYFLGIILAHSLIGFGQTVLVFAIASWQGAEFKGSLLAGILVIMLSIVGYVGVGFILGTQLARRTEDVNALVATFGVPLLIVGGAFFPTSFFPVKLLEIAQFNPIYHMNESLTGIWARGDNLDFSDFHWQFLCGFSILVMGLGWLSYRQMIRQERRL